MRSGIVLVGVALASTLAGCALLTSFDGYSSAAAGPSSDAGEPDADAPEIDAPDAAAGSQDFCASYPNAIACTTFDNDSVETGFDLVKSADTTVARTTTSFVSAPSSMLATVSSSTSSGNEATGYLRTSMEKPLSRWFVRFSFRVTNVSPDAENDVAIASVNMRAGSRSHEVSVAVNRDNRLFIDEWSASPAVYEHNAVATLTDGWHTLEQVIELSTVGAGTVTVTLDGVSMEIPIRPNVAIAERSTAALGAVLARGAQSGWSVAFDDYVVEAR